MKDGNFRKGGGGVDKEWTRRGGGAETEWRGLEEERRSSGGGVEEERRSSGGGVEEERRRNGGGGHLRCFWRPGGLEDQLSLSCHPASTMSTDEVHLANFHLLTPTLNPRN